MFLFVSFRKSCESPQISESFGKNPVSEKPWEAFLGSYQMIYKDFASNNLSEICFHWWADECLSSSKKGLCSVPETSECLVCLLLNIHHILTRTLPRPYMMWHVYIYIRYIRVYIWTDYIYVPWLYDTEKSSGSWGPLTETNVNPKLLSFEILTSWQHTPHRANVKTRM